MGNVLRFERYDTSEKKGLDWRAHLQSLATQFIQNIIDNNPSDLFCWSDGSIRKHLPNSAGVSSVISTTTDIISECATRVNTTSISVAEICGIISSLKYVCTNLPKPKHIHILCDNQYVIKAICNDCKINPAHTVYLTTISTLVNYLQRKNYTITFHRIPSHTDNIFHTKTDTLAFDATTSPLTLMNPSQFNTLADHVITGLGPGQRTSSPYCQGLKYSFANLHEITL